MAKRAFDLFVSLTGLIVAAPLLLALALLVRVFLGSPVLFRQVRPGQGTKPFEILKFRTMTDATGTGGVLLPDSERLTRFGRFLRASSLDELPELWNVLIGEMSLVGPRPLLMEYVPLYNEQQMRRHAVRPGITGWSQVNGRNAISWDEKFALDIWYVDNQSMLLDLKILFMTVASIVKREGINASQDVPMPKFTGSKGEG
ncbi:sugar transferase [Sphingorhabdus sp.]|jgi:lipopolysaccharide/colanic/teichoic acid biosynthesis glycosyltransferase|uniref:sugar transferase n=1 Tax=Sphingorhabdus sp. TaxID=1902408 RepID=UPI003BAF6006|nr:sugar transferase [Sphingomonadales bacterium]MBK9431516.1 sugar transferase [Sphingomonadales bacterium]MBL0023160.1 sugar transferase [Sphingomonadales bacterium]